MVVVLGVSTVEADLSSDESESSCVDNFQSFEFLKLFTAQFAVFNPSTRGHDKVVEVDALICLSGHEDDIWNAPLIFGGEESHDDLWWKFVDGLGAFDDGLSGFGSGLNFIFAIVNEADMSIDSHTECLVEGFE